MYGGDQMSIEGMNRQVNIQSTHGQSTDNEIRYSVKVQSNQEVKQKMQLDPAYEPTLQEKTLLHAVEEINTKLSGQNIEVEVSFHEKTKEPIIKLVNTVSKEVVREIPSEKLVDMIATMCELAGLYVDEKR